MLNISEWNLYSTPLPSKLAVVPTCIMAYILGSNMVVLNVFRRWSKPLQIQHFFMVALAFADLMTLLPYIVALVILIRGRVWLTVSQCNWLGIAMSLTLETTACIHSLMCIEKCASVLKPIEHRIFSFRSCSKPLVIAAAFGCFATPFAFNIFFLHHHVIYFIFDPFGPTCTIGSSLQTMIAIGIAFMYLPLAIQMITHALIIGRLIRLKGVNRTRALRASKTVFLTVGVYYLCWAPVAAQFVWISGWDGHPPGWFVFTAVQILQMNSGMSLLIYSVSLPHFHIFKRFNQPVISVVSTDEALRKQATSIEHSINL